MSTQQVLLITCRLNAFATSLPGPPLSIGESPVQSKCALEQSSFNSIPGQYICYLYVLPVCYLYAASKLRTTQSSIPASMLSIRIASMLFTCCFEASNHPIFHSWPVCYLYVLPVCYLHAASKLRTTQSSIPGLYAIYTYFQYASFEPLNLPFPASMLSIRIFSMLFTCCFEPPNLPFPASMLSICIACMLFTGCFEASNLPISACMLSIRIACMLFTCCFEASNHPIFHSRPVCYLYVLPVCYLYAASKLRTTQSSIPASMLSIRIASMPSRCCFEASNLPIFHSRPVCYQIACKWHTGNTYRYIYLQYAIYMLLRTSQSSMDHIHKNDSK